MIKGLVVAFVGLLATGYGHPTERSDNGLELEKKQTPDGYGSSLVTVGSGLTIITHNDLYGNMSSRTDAAILLSEAMTHAEARSACETLGEKLWRPGSDTSFLASLAYEGQVGPFWTAGRDASGCSNIISTGVQAFASCDVQSPALCTQSAPLSNATYADNSTQWRTTVSSGEQSWTGFRDRFSFRFEGIRYAAQPERFTYSSVYNQSGHSDALTFGSECVQGGNVGSEDCLFLNIWSPSLPLDSDPPSTQLKPVLFWIHGGAFTSGTGSDPTFDGGSLVSRGDVVVVTINYRLGTLGFLALEDGKTKGNFGLADQVTALKWVSEHIKAFGGDPSRVTIAGQSAGAASVRALLASPEAAGLFAAAIPQSNLAGLNYATTYSEYYSIKEEYNQFAKPILNITNCTDASSHIQCLRNINPYFLANQSDPDIARYLVVDGRYLLSDHLAVSGKGYINTVPVLMGIMRDDGAAFISYPEPNDTLNSFLKTNGFHLNQLGDLSLFPEPSAKNATLDLFNQSALISTDAQFRCLDYATAYSATLHSTLSPVYFYEFNRSYQLSFYSPNYPVCQPPPTPSHPYGDPSKEYFKCHSGELYYVFGTLAFNGLPERDGEDIPMSQFIVDTWAAFVRRWDPTPDPVFLALKGFTNTSMEIAESGNYWRPVVEGEGLRVRVLEYPSHEASFGKSTECDTLGLPIDYYES